MIFLIEYDRSRGELVSVRSFPDAHRRVAEDDRLARELEFHRSGIEREIVLLHAESEAALRKTHRRYFEDVATLVASMAASIRDVLSARR